MNIYKSYIDGKWLESEEKVDVLRKYDNSIYAKMSVNTQEEINLAVSSAKKAQKAEVLAPYRRYEILMEATRLMRERSEEIGTIISAECGKPIKEAIGEVLRGAHVMEFSAEEAKRIAGHGVPIESFPGSENRRAFTIRVPLGVVCAITPFNYPINLGSHKVGPAIASGNAVILKPTKEAPGCSVKFVEILLDAGLPPKYIQLVLGSGGRIGDMLIKNPDINFFSFTGSAQVGLHLKQNSGIRRCALELGSNSGVIVHNDVKDVKAAARLVAQKSFSYAGQSCISVQRVYVHKDICDEFTVEAKHFAETLVLGDPSDMATQMGPMIGVKEVERIDRWIQEAVTQGAELVTGGERFSETVYRPTILRNVTNKMKVFTNEAFGPLFSIVSYEDIEDAFVGVNDSEYGLQAGVFTSNLEIMMRAAEVIDAGGININETSLFRPDNMPYGGMKNSGIGREGPRYAVEEMTEEKTIMINL